MKKFLLIFCVFFCSCKSQWKYDSSQSWSDLDEEFKFCKIGYNQSPIDIKDEFVASDLKFFYQKSDVEKDKKNYALNINFDDGNFLLRGKKKYHLRSIIFHHPSEHEIKGERHSLEMQLYHKSEDEQKLFLAIFLELGDENRDFNDLINFIESKEKHAEINPKKFVDENDRIFFYEGSLTFPPCTEGVKWYVTKKPIKISKEQMKKIIKSAIFVKSNSRLVQKFNPEKY